MSTSDSVKCWRRRTVRFEQFSTRHRIPRKEPDPALFAPIQRIFVTTIAKRIPILHRNDWNDLLRLFDLFRCNFAEADMANLPLFLHLSKGSKALFKWRPGIDPV